MFAPILKLVPALRLPTTSLQSINHEQIAIDACVAAVQIYIPCDSIAPTNYTCLCEQYTWHVACYDNHASSPTTRPDHASTTQKWHSYCNAAGDIEVKIVQENYRQQRRQLNSILNSVGGVVASFLSSQTAVAIPTAIRTIRLPSIAPLASVTSQSNAPASSARGSGLTLAPTTLLSSASPISSDASQSSPQSTSSPPPATSSATSSPSPGLIAGAVIGGVAVLALLGILIMLILRHKRKKRQSPLPTAAYQSATGTASARSLDETLVDRTPMTEHQVQASSGHTGNEKEVYRSSEPEVSMPRESELYTSANVWELDGRDTAVPSELESPVVREGMGGFDFGLEEGKAEKRYDRSELHF